MGDAALRRMLERATGEPPADLEARVFQGARRPWRWTAVAAAVVLVAGALAWSLARREPSKQGLTTQTRAPAITVHLVGDGTRVATWLPDGFHETTRSASSTTWMGPRGATITYRDNLSFGTVACTTCEREAFAPPNYFAEVHAIPGGEQLVWCNGASCGLEVHGVSRLDALRVAVGLASAGRLHQTSSSGVTFVPGLVGQWSKFVDTPGLQARLVFRGDRADREEYVVAQMPLAGATVRVGSVITLEVGAQPHYDGFEPLRSGGQLVGWMDTRLAHLDGPIPVVSFRKEERLQGYLVPNRGFVWLDQIDESARDATSTIPDSATPSVGTLPKEVVLLNESSGSRDEDGRIVLYDLNGTQLASLAGWKPDDQSGRGQEVLMAPGGRLYRLGRSGLEPATKPGSPSHDRCQATASAGEQVCVSEVTGRNDVEPTITLERSGQAPRRITGSPVSKWPNGEYPGHWSSAELGPDGRTILATWSGECESPAVYLVDLVTGRAFQPASGGTIRESTGMGWSASGEAIVYFTTGICGTAAPVPGVYRVRPNGTVAGLVTKVEAISAYAVLVEVPN